MMGWRNRVIVGQTDKGSKTRDRLTDKHIETLMEEHVDGQMDGSKTTIQT